MIAYRGRWPKTPNGLLSMTTEVFSVMLLAGASLVAGPALADPTALNRLAVNTSCLIEANTVARLSSQSQGVLAKVHVRRGDAVKANAVVAELESGVELALLKAARIRADSDALIRSKRAELGNAQRKFERQRQLSTSQITSLQNLEQAETDVAVLRSQVTATEQDRELARVEVERLEATIERRLLRAPTNGVVVSVDRYAGEYADSNTVVATLTEIEPLRVEVYLPVEAYPLVRLGLKATVRPQEPIGGAYPAEIMTKDPQIDAASGLFQVQLRLPNPDGVIPAGLRCRVEF